MMPKPDLLICPKTHKRLFLSERGDRIKTELGEVSYPVHNQMIDFCPDATGASADAYNPIATHYDSLLTNASFLSRLYNKIVWNVRDEDYIRTLMDFMPANFSGILLDVPVGTGVFTAELYRKYPQATIFALDYSPAMLLQAQKRFRDAQLKNIQYLRGDVGCLPVQDATIDLVISMNGFHAFPHKEAAWDEITRVLKKGGKFIGCFYIRGKRPFTDFFIRQIYTRLGAFKAPFWSENEVLERLEQHYLICRKGNYRSIFYFEAEKR